MSHQWRIRRALTAHRHGELAGAARRNVEAHLEQCAECRDLLQREEEADRLLHTARPAPTALPPDAAQAIFIRALQEAGLQADGRPRSSRLRSLAWCLGLTCLAALALLAIRPHRPAGNVGKIAQNGNRLLDTAPKIYRVASLNIATEPEPAAPYMPDLTTFSGPRFGASSPHPPRRRKHHRWSEGYAVAHLQRQNRPAPSVVPVLPDRELQTVQATTEPQEPEGRLVVMVTHEPGLAIEVTHTAEDAPGYAEATCFRRDSDGDGIWQRCMIRKSETGTDTMQTQIAMVTPEPESELLIVQAETTASARSGKEPGQAANRPEPAADKSGQPMDRPMPEKDQPEQAADQSKQTVDPPQHSEDRPEQAAIAIDIEENEEQNL